MERLRRDGRRAARGLRAGQTDAQSRLCAQVGGFDALCGSNGPRHFTLEGYAGWPMETLPKAHTCFNTLCLPTAAGTGYKSAAALRAKLEVAVRETECGGFELV